LFLKVYGALSANPSVTFQWATAAKLPFMPRPNSVRRDSDESESGRTIACHKQVTKRILQNFIVVVALVGVALVTVACPEKGPAEKAGEKIDDAVDKTKDAVK